MNFITFFFLIVCLCSFAVPERQFNSLYQSTILPFFDQLTEGELKNAEGMGLRYFEMKKNSHKKALVIIPGRTEPARKYAEVIFDLKDKGFDIYIMDHQGQGESDRLLSDSQRGHVIRFINYVKDLEQFMQEVVLKEKKEVYLLAHSMGGSIAVHYLSRNPDVVKKAVLMSPMLQVNTKPYKEMIARFYARALVLTGQGDEYAPGQKSWTPVPFEENLFSHSEVRFSVEKFLFTNWPQLALGGATAKWVLESLKATKHIDKLTLSTPILMFQAGEDEIVMPERQNSFCQRNYCQKVTLPGARHEILMEKDSLRDDAMRRIAQFFGF